MSSTIVILSNHPLSATHRRSYALDRSPRGACTTPAENIVENIVEDCRLSDCFKLPYSSRTDTSSSCSTQLSILPPILPCRSTNSYGQAASQNNHQLHCNHTKNQVRGNQSKMHKETRNNSMIMTVHERKRRSGQSRNSLCIATRKKKTRETRTVCREGDGFDRAVAPPRWENKPPINHAARTQPAPLSIYQPCHR